MWGGNSLTSMALDVLRAAGDRSGLFPKASDPGPPDRLRWDDPLLYGLAFIVGLVPIIAVLVRGAAWGAEPTVGMLFCVISGGALSRHALGTYLTGHHRYRAEERSGS